MRDKQQTALPPGVIATVTAGFDSTAKHLWLIVIPVLLDAFFWLGPRLSFGALVEQMVTFWQQGQFLVDLNTEALLDLAPRTNLFTSLSIPVMGVPAFLVGATPAWTPLQTSVREVDSIWMWALLTIGLSIVGLLLTSFYYGLIARVIGRDSAGHGDILQEVRRFIAHAVMSWLQLLLLAAAVVLGLLVISLPLLLVGALVSLISTVLSSIVLMLLPMLGLWLLFYLGLVPHGLLLHRRPVWRATVESFQILRTNMLAALGLLLLMLIIGRVVDWLLLLAEDGSWFTAVSILGHAYVSTALVAATFIFYRDRYAFLQLKKQSSVQPGH